MSDPQSDAVQRIARLSRRGSDALGFDALRETGIELVQQASGTLWTDYNLHDPGVTLLEVLSYALTEDVFANRRSVPALLGLDEPASDAALARHGLLQPGQALPCRPSTAADHQRWLHDCLPGAAHLGMGCDAQTGLWQIRLLADARAPDAHCAAAAAAVTAYWPQRNLGEDLLGWPLLLTPRWVQLELHISVQGDRDLVDLLGELVLRCEDFIMARPARHTPATRHAEPGLAGIDPGEAGGPAQRQGHIDDGELHRIQADRLYLSDLARALQGIDGLAAVHTLALREPGQAPDAALPVSLPWRDERNALALRWPRLSADLARWRVQRQGSTVLLPEQALLRHLSDLRGASLHLRLPPAATPTGPRHEPPRAPADFVPASAELPLIYQHPQLLRWHSDPHSDRHGERFGEPVGAASKAERRQWLGYLALLELPLAQLQAQREHLGALYAVDGNSAQSYWWHLPSELELPELATLYRDGPQSLLQRLGEDDPALERRSRVLDHLLALHGEALDHHDLQGLPCYLGARDWALHLLSLKRRLAEQVQRHTEHRHAGIDYSRPSFGHSDNIAPLQERLALQLAFAQTHSHSLSRALLEAGLQLAPERGAAEAALPVRRPRPGRSLPPPDAAERGMSGTAPDWAGLARDSAALRGAVEPSLLRSAVQWERFQLEGDTQRPDLLLGPDGHQRLWCLARSTTPAAALDLALRLHDAACRLQFASEGLHLVEHQLLRPSTMPHPDPFYRHRLSLVFPGWTARCASKRFRRLARELARQAAPAHLHCRLLWLGPDQMKSFELLYQSWLRARQSHCKALSAQSSEANQRAQHLDERAAALVALLREAGA